MAADRGRGEPEPFAQMRGGGAAVLEQHSGDPVARFHVRAQPDVGTRGGCRRGGRLDVFHNIIVADIRAPGQFGLRGGSSEQDHAG
ncbi:hypothetical protein GCM10009539_52960 [Cryptosporangium japonicum]|uniref:Uncharacterized protein n=1 Tax=Cryptosporangium japonicum TaxID=80872 RepID=A0ABN0UTA8_9ACTN